MFNISLNSKKSIFCVVLLTVLSACSANTQGKNDTELNFEAYKTKQEADDALGKLIKSGMPASEALAILNKSGFKCSEWELVDAKKHEEEKKEIFKKIQVEDSPSITTKYYQDTYAGAFPKKDFYNVRCSITKNIDVLASLSWRVNMIIEQEDKTNVWRYTSAFNYRYP